jgi:hypothetical protein
MSNYLLGDNIELNNINSVYNTNLNDNIKILNKKQSFNNKYLKSEFLIQFDDLKLDNINNPLSINETKGLNKNLIRDIEFNNSYCEIQNLDMHYDINVKDKWTHNNMIPFTNKRDIHVGDNNQRKLGALSGATEYYMEKKEVKKLFEPMADLTWTNGAPSMTDDLKKRYLPNYKNNKGNLPFQNNVKVLPGVNNLTQTSRNAVYRINPKNIDETRNSDNQKITYNNKPLVTIKKGEYRAPDYNITKFKLPDFREQTIDELVPNKSAVEKPKQTGIFSNIDTLRNMEENYIPKPGINTNLGIINVPNFEESNKEIYYNDFPHSFNDVNNRPVMTNIKSYNIKDNERVSTNILYDGPIYNNQISSYTVDYKDVPLKTIKESIIHGDTNMGANNQVKNNYIFSNDMVLPTTNRQSTSHNIINNPTPIDNSNKLYNQDIAKNTNRQTTSHNIINNAAPSDKNNKLYNQDKVKNTGRQTTTHNIVTNTNPIEQANKLYYQDKLKNTIRQTTSHNLINNTAPVDKNIKLYYQDKLKNTVRQTTSHNLINNTAPTEKTNKLYLQDGAKITTRQTTSHSLINNTTSMEKSNKLYLQDDAKITTRQTTSHNLINNTTSMEKSNKLYLQDDAKTTIKQTTSHNLINNATSMEKSNKTYYTDFAKNTIKESTLSNNYQSNVNNINSGNYSNIQDDVRPTIKQTSLITDRNYGNVGNTDSMYAIYTRDINNKAKNTIKETTEMSEYISNIYNVNDEGTYVDYNDEAKTTIKQNTVINEYLSNINDIKGNYTKDYCDVAKPTIKQSTLYNNYIGNLNNTNESSYYKDSNDIAKNTVKQTTINNTYISNINNNNDLSYIKNNDIAKPTIKQSTIYLPINGRLNNNNMGNYSIDHNDLAKNTIKQTTITNTYISNPKNNIKNKFLIFLLIICV